MANRIKTIGNRARSELVRSGFLFSASLLVSVMSNLF